MNFGWSQIETAVSSKLARLKKYKWRILAVTVFLAVLSPVAVVTYLSSREQPVYMDDEQWGLFFDPESGFPRTLLSDKFPKFYKIVLESIDA